MANKASLRKTYRCQTEAKDKVWTQNKETEKALETPSILYECFEQVNSDLANVNMKFCTEFEEMQEAMEEAKEAQHFAEIALQAASGTRGHHQCNSYGCECDVDWNGVRTENEQDYVREALTLLNKMLCEEDKEGYELVIVGKFVRKS